MTQPARTPTSPPSGARVCLLSAGPQGPCDPDVDWGEIESPTARQREVGRTEFGDDLAEAVLVRWRAGDARWEYAEDLYVPTQEVSP